MGHRPVLEVATDLGHLEPVQAADGGRGRATADVIASSMEVVDVPTTSVMPYVCAMVSPSVGGPRQAPVTSMILAVGPDRLPRRPNRRATASGTATAYCRHGDRATGRTRGPPAAGADRGCRRRAVRRAVRPARLAAASSGEERAEPGLLLVAVDDAGDGLVVGFAHVLDLAGRWHLEQIAVDPPHGRRGVGAALLAAVHTEVARRGGTEVTLLTYADVPWNRPWYAVHGYEELECVPDHLLPFVEGETRMGLSRYGRRTVMSRRVGA